MNEEHDRSDHLVRNLKRISPENSIFNYKYGRKAFLSLGKENIREWLKTFLPNTRLIIEPKIMGTSIGIQYSGGKLNKAINENIEDITESVRSIKNIPQRLPFKKKIEIQGVLYEEKDSKSNKYETQLN